MNGTENMDLQEEPQDNQFSINLEPDSLPGENAGEDHLESERLEVSELTKDNGVSDRSEERMKGHRKKESKDIHQGQFESFLKDFQEESHLENKLQLAVDFMEVSLAQGETPHFRHFWEARKLCLPLFKENISPILRSQLWHKYSELSKEARRLKDILDEQSAFAVEQIEIAINALEQDISQFDQSSGQDLGQDFLIDSNLFMQVLQDKQSSYQNLQGQLSVLNVQASRINALRKELLKTEMRIRQKNKFFQRLSAAGDKVFPRRKDLIKLISQQFIEDVNDFIKVQCGGDLEQESSLYNLREDIKALQGLAKVLTLNTNAFTQTRLKLSECWDQIKFKEKARKKERAQQKAVFRQNADAILQQIQELRGEMEQGNRSIPDVNKQMDEIVAIMRETELGREELRKLREALSGIRNLIQEKARAEESLKQQQESERVRQKKERYKSLKEEAEALIYHHDSYDAEKLIANRESLNVQIQESSLSKGEKQELERLMKPLKDIITEKKEKALLSLSEDDRQSFQQLRNILQQRKNRRQEIKNQLESYRKLVGSSSLDFEKAMGYNAQINEEKERLEKINQGIKEIEIKIAELQAKI